MDVTVVGKLEKHFRDRYYSNFITTKNESAHILYTDLLGTFGNSPKSVDIQSRLVEDIESNSKQRSFVVFGDSGSGKTSLALYLCDKLWRKWENAGEETRESLYIPIYIPLRQVELRMGCENLLSNFCKIYFKEIEDEHLLNSNLILFLDGYDELKEKICLWQYNDWGFIRNIKIKTVTFCKTIALKASEREHLFTVSQSEKGEGEKSNFIFIQPFKIEQIGKYVEKTVKFLKSIRVHDEEFRNDPWMMTKRVTNHTLWESDTTEYQKWLIEIFPDLNKLASNPHLLTIILQILPNIVEQCRPRGSQTDKRRQLEREIRARISTEVGVYDEFVSQWFKYQTERSRWSKTEPDFIKIPSHHQSAFMRAYAQNLCFNLMKENDGLLSDGTFSEADTNLWHLWKPTHNEELVRLIATDSKYSELFPTREYDPQSRNENEDILNADELRRIQNLQALRSACLLTSLNNGRFKFFHSSLVEYFASRDVFENIRGKFNFYLKSDSAVNDQFGINTTDLTETSFLPILKHLAQRVQTDNDGTFKTLLFDIIDKSKEIFILRRMSANAVTILNIAGVSLSGRDFRNVQIPNANLTGANLANSDFRFANLEGANLQQSWMVGCKFQGANFEGVNFGQVSSVNLNSGHAIGIEPYLSNGESCLIITYQNAKIESYNYNSGVVSEIKCPTLVRNYANVPYIVENGLMIRSIDDHLHKIPKKASVVLLKRWNLDKNEQIEDILVHCSGPILQHDELINAEFLRLAYYAANLEMVGYSNPKAYNVEPPASSILLGRYTNCGNTDGETYYYYEVGLVTKLDVRLAILWTYFVEKGHVRHYENPIILETSRAVPGCEDKIIFRLYADISISCWHVHLSEARSLVAVKCRKFVKIFLIFPTHELIFDEILQTDPFKPTTTITIENIKFSPNGQYLIYRSDFVYLWNIGCNAPVKLLEVDTSARFEKCFFVVFDKSSEMVSFLYIDTIFICTLPSGTIIKKIVSKDLQIFSTFPTFAFIEHTTTNISYLGHLFGESGKNKKIFSYISVESSSLETIITTDTIEPPSNQRIQGLVLKIRVSDDNTRVATFHRDNKEDHFISVYDTPINSNQSLSLRFRFAYRYIYVYDMAFTPNYLLVTLDDEALVFDMDGNYSSFNTKFNNQNWKIPFLSSKYQKIVFCENLSVEYKLQLCTISETLTSDGLPSVEFKDQKYKCFRHSFVSDVRFDSRDGNTLLLQTHLDLRNNDSYARVSPTNYGWWLWIPSENYAREIRLQPSASIVEFQHVFTNMAPKVSSQVEAFFMTSKKSMYVSNIYGYYFLNISDTRPLKRERYCLTYENSESVTKSKFFPNVDWVVYGTSRCQLYIYSVKNSKKLAEFLLPHPVYDFNLKFNYGGPTDEGLAAVLESVETTIWSLSGFCSSLTFGTTPMFRDWKIDWMVKSHTVLKLEQAEIAKTYKVDANTGLLKRLNVSVDIGEPWPENYLSLSELYIPITKIDTKTPILRTADCSGSQRTINENLWVVSVIAKNMNSNCRNSNKIFVEHVGLLIEGIMNGRHFVWEAHLTKNERGKSVRILLFPLSDTKRLDQLVNHHVAMQWVRRKSQVQNLIRGIQEDQISDLKYNFFRKNCTTWCFEKLKLAGIFATDNKKGFMKFCKVDQPSDLFLLRDKIVKTRLPFKLSKKRTLPL